MEIDNITPIEVIEDNETPAKPKDKIKAYRKVIGKNGRVMYLYKKKKKIGRPKKRGPKTTKRKPKKLAHGRPRNPELWTEDGVRIHPSGTHKRKIGRPKKRGAKKTIDYRTRRRLKSGRKKRHYYYKKKKGPRKKPNVYRRSFRLMLCNNGKRRMWYGKFKTIVEAEDRLVELTANNENVVYPVGTTNCDRDVFRSSLEYVLIRSVNPREHVLNQPKIRNEYGLLVDHVITNSDKWMIVCKTPALIEEKFWVFGYDKRKDRKDFMWCFNNLVWKVIEDDKQTLVRMSLFRNKVIFVYEDESCEVVICKNQSDGIRFYNLVIEKLPTSKLYQVVQYGQMEIGEYYYKYSRALVMEKTGWGRYSFSKPTTTH